MSRKELYIKLSIAFLTALGSAYLVYTILQRSDLNIHQPKLEMCFDTDRETNVQFYIESNGSFTVQNMQEVRIPAAVTNYKISFPIPDVSFPGKIRIDLGSTRGNWNIKYIKLKGPASTVIFNPDSIKSKFTAKQHIEKYEVNGDQLEVLATSHDPYLISNFELYDYYNVLKAKNKFNTIALVITILINILVFIFLFYRLKNIQFKGDVIQVGYIVVFLLIITIPLIYTFIGASKQNGENRKLTLKPTLSASNLFSYPKDYNAYFNDNFGFRKELITLNSYLKLKLFNTSSKPDKVIIGKKSWLYSVDPVVSVDYKNNTSYTFEQLELIRYNLEEIYAWHKEKGIHFYMFIAPSKFSIYPEYLPSNVHISKKPTKLQQIQEHLEKYSTFRLTTSHEELIAAKKNTEVFYSHDTHWNFQGGFIAYTKLMQEIHKDIPELVPMQATMFENVLKAENNADLAKQLSLENILRNDEWILRYKKEPGFTPGKESVYGTVYPIQPTIFFDHKNDSLPRLLMYRDSYTNLMLVYLSAHFSRSVYLWTHEYSAEVVEIEKPNVVVFEIVETHLDKLLESNPVDFRKPK